MLFLFVAAFGGGHVGIVDEAAEVCVVGGAGEFVKGEELEFVFSDGLGCERGGVG